MSTNIDIEMITTECERRTAALIRDLELELPKNNVVELPLAKSAISISDTPVTKKKTSGIRRKLAAIWQWFKRTERSEAKTQHQPAKAAVVVNQEAEVASGEVSIPEPVNPLAEQSHDEGDSDAQPIRPAVEMGKPFETPLPPWIDGSIPVAKLVGEAQVGPDELSDWKLYQRNLRKTINKSFRLLSDV